MKLWDIHSGACVATFDEHTDRVWALAGSASGDLLVTGGADATICVWQDATREKLEEATAAKLVNATAQQDFSNAMQVFKPATLLYAKLLCAIIQKNYSYFINNECLICI